MSGNEPATNVQGTTRRTFLGAVAGLSIDAAIDTADALTAGSPASRWIDGEENVTMQNDPLPSWNDGAAKQAILAFVAAVTAEGSDQFVPPGDRIATFDNDGTLWTEQPNYAQGFFMLDQIKKLAPQHPEWQTEQPYAAVLAGDEDAMQQFSEEDLGKLMAAAHTGMTTDEFAAQARAWAHAAKSPLTGHLFIESVYQPQLELLDYLRASGFRTYIVSGAAST